MRRSLPGAGRTTRPRWPLSPIAEIRRWVQEELELYVIQVIEWFATPDRRGIKLPEGNVSSMRIQKNPDSVLITDIDSIPLMFKQIVLTMPGYVWEAMLKRIGFEDRKGFEARVEKREFRPNKKRGCECELCI